MGKFQQIIEKLNEYLAKQGLAKIAGDPQDLDALYESAVRSIWQDPDKKKRENIAAAVASSLTKYFGGKNLEQTYQKVMQKINAEDDTNKQAAEGKAEVEKKNDPNYIPSFDDLFKK